MLVCEGSLCPKKLTDVSEPGLGEAGRYSCSVRRADSGVSQPGLHGRAPPRPTKGGGFLLPDLGKESLPRPTYGTSPTSSGDLADEGTGPDL